MDQQKIIGFFLFSFFQNLRILGTKPIDGVHDDAFTQLNTSRARAVGIKAHREGPA